MNTRDTAMDHLSSTDASYLHLETPETPTHIGSLMLFELPDGYNGDFFEDVKAVLAKRLHLCSLFHRKLAQMPFELADPIWVEDDDVDIDYHVRSLTLRRPGTMAQLEQLVARLHSSLLDRSRPLWEAYVIDGLENGQIAYYTKVHHSTIDGKAAVEMGKVLYDVSPVIREVPPARRTRRSHANPLGVVELLQAAVSNTTKMYSDIGALLPTAFMALGTATQAVASRKLTEDKRSLDLGIAPKTIFNASITNQRSFTTMSLPFDEMKSLSKAVGGTVNTLVMAMCSGALRRFLAERDLLPDSSLIAMVPVSLRSDDDRSMNNQVSAVRVDLATDIADRAERFKAIHASSESAKAIVRELKPVLGAQVPVFGAPWLMTGMASLFGRTDLQSRLPSVANVLISNVPGLPTTLYMAGARMVHYYPVAIPYHGLAVNITVQSYAGSMEFGITACRHVLSQEESQELIGHLVAELEAIRRLKPAETQAVATEPAVMQEEVASANEAATPEDAPVRRAPGRKRAQNHEATEPSQAASK
ncbi:wax ester/triacylglycerol synthase family O-acyltransferase [Caballeronia sp. GAFFF1]|uniref:WS/DGAT/MGAT family O-acyltransferase n=1 Tax=Caballeronia sp. GAFFF1 TaxID=2921779 RepID=UPI002029308D|nr:wax ester/triacylglycerol synthase family O-acyltransferase [Caballeronia sp. GAFFF1]